MSMDFSSGLSNSVHVSLPCLQLFFSDWDENVDGTNGSDGLKLVTNSNKDDCNLAI